MDETPAALAAPEVPRERRLAAVVFTDVVGYSAMMNADEALTIERVGADLARMQAQCVARGGECLNTMGDGLMLAFSSTVHALSFAMETQEEFALRNEAPDAGRPLVQHRIGIHLGDVIRMRDGTLAGDGVNIAARLESSAPPGGICISQTVHDTVRGKLAFDAEFAGPKTFKNIAQPIAVWHLHPRGAIPATRAAVPARQRVGIGRRTAMAGVGAAAAIAGAGVWWWRRGADASVVVGFDPKSIAVLPFANMSDDKDTTYFADGMHEDLLTQLALMSQLKVVSRTSVMEYRNTAKKIPQIGNELKVASLVEGSVRRAGNVVRVTAQLVDANSDKHIWAANYDRDLKDIFKVQSELALEIAKSLNVSLSAAEEKRLARPPTANLQAYELFLRHQALVRSVEGSLRSISSVKDRVELLQQAVALDPAFALAWAKLAAEHARAKGYGLDPQGDQKGLAEQAIAKALTLAPDDLQVKIEEAAVKLHALDDQAGSRRAYEQVLAKAPYNVEALVGLEEVLSELGLNIESIRALETAMSVDSRNARVLIRLASSHGRYRHFDRALALRKQMLDIRPGDLDIRTGIEFWTYFKTGNWDSFDAWRPTLAPNIEKRMARMRFIDTARAIARGDFDMVHRLIDLDSDDLRNSMIRTADKDIEIRSEHALAWNASGDRKRAADSAVEVIRRADKVLDGSDANSVSIETKAMMHALLGQSELAHAAMDRAVAETQRGGNQSHVAGSRRRRTRIDALLGEHDRAIAGLKHYSRFPGFYIHDERLALELAPLWKHPDFIALVNDPATNAPLPLDTPLADNQKR